MFQPMTGRTPMTIDMVHIAVSSTQACFALTLRPGSETIARYLKVMKTKTHFFDENRLYLVLSFCLGGTPIYELYRYVPL